MAYKRSNIPVADFISRLLSEQALPTGGESPFRIDKEVFAQLQAAGPNGLEATLTEINGVSGGMWQDDNDFTRQSYIGNFGCRVQVGAHSTFANLDVATTLRFAMNGGKCVVKLHVPIKNGAELKNRSGEPIHNIIAKDSLVVNVKDTAQRTALENLATMFAPKSTANVVVGGANP